MGDGRGCEPLRLIVHLRIAGIESLHQSLEHLDAIPRLGAHTGPGVKRTERPLVRSEERRPRSFPARPIRDRAQSVPAMSTASALDEVCLEYQSVNAAKSSGDTQSSTRLHAGGQVD